MFEDPWLYRGDRCSLMTFIHFLDFFYNNNNISMCLTAQDLRSRQHSPNYILVVILNMKVVLAGARLKMLLGLNKFYHCTKLEVSIFNSLWDILSKQYFGDHFEYEAGATFGPNFNRFVPSLVCTYMLSYMIVSQICFPLSHRQESGQSDGW